MKSSQFLALAMATLICAQFSAKGVTHEKVEHGQKSGEATKRTMVVRIDNDADVKKLLDGRTTAIYDCIRILNEPNDPASFDANTRRGRAASLLGTLRSSDHHEAIELLVKNVTFRYGSYSHSEDDALVGFAAAEAIVEIGSPAVGELLKSVVSERTDDELRLVAFIINRVDGRELGLRRIELEIKQVLENGPGLRDTPDAQVKNLRKLQTWFADMEFFRKRNWPYRAKIVK